MGRFLKIFFVCLLAFSTQAGAGYAPGDVGTITVCGEVLATSGLIQLYASVTSSGYQSTFRRATNTDGTETNVSYTPSGANKFHVKAMKVIILTGNAGSVATLNYADTDTGWRTGGGTPFVNPKYFAGQSGAGVGGFPLATNAFSGNGIQEFMECMTTDFIVPNGKYVGTKGDQTNSYYAQVYGYEE